MKEKFFLSKEDLKELLNWRSDKGVLSVYLSLEERDVRIVQKWKALIRGHLKTVLSRFPEDKVLEETAEKAYEDLYTIPFDLRKRSLVYFRDASTGKTFMRSLQLPLGSAVIWMERAYLRPIVAMLDSAPVLGIVIISQELVRVLTWRQGIIYDEEERLFPIDTGLDKETPPAGSKTGYRAQADLYAQKVEVAVKRALSKLGNDIAKCGEELKWDSVMLVGSHKYTDVLEDSLPPQWQSKVIGKLEKNYIHAPITQIADSITELLHTWRTKIEENLVDTVIDTAQGGGKAVLGVQETIDALEQHRASHFLFSSDLQVEGYKDESGSILVDFPEGEELGLIKEPHVVERMIEMAFDSGTRVTPLEGTPSEKLKKYEGAAAFLRY